MLSTGEMKEQNEWKMSLCLFSRESFLCLLPLFTCFGARSPPMESACSRRSVSQDSPDARAAPDCLLRRNERKVPLPAQFQIDIKGMPGNWKLAVPCLI